jgi:hypothetical protein
MKFCEPHWQSLREAVEATGLGALVAESGQQAARNLASEATEGPTFDNFDPLMTAHNAILSGAMSLIKERYNQNALMVMADDEEHPEWACPICALNWCHAEHDRLCVQDGCNYPKGYTYDEEAIGEGIASARRQWDHITGVPAEPSEVSKP